MINHILRSSRALSSVTGLIIILTTTGLLRGGSGLSFTRQVKQELARCPGVTACCRSWELAALVLLRGYLNIRDHRQNLNIVTEYSAQARHAFKLLKEAGIDNPVVIRQQERRLGKNRYLVQVAGEEKVDALLIYLGLKDAGRSGHPAPAARMMAPNRCCRRAFIRGAFMAGGSVSLSSTSGYHLEIGCIYQEDAQMLQQYLSDFSLNPSIRRHNDVFSLYFKKAEAIADFFRIIGASSALLHLENVRVIKSMRNQVNRLVNCETANLDKVVYSAQQQLAAIDQIERKLGLKKLHPALREAALLRRRFPEASLRELGQMLEPPVSKSAMNHRFRQLKQVAAKWQ